MASEGEKVVDEIIRDLNRIPREVVTEISLKEITDKVAKRLQKELKRRVS
jgi:hypothetical protein